MLVTLPECAHITILLDKNGTRDLWFASLMVCYTRLCQSSVWYTSELSLVPSIYFYDIKISKFHIEHLLCLPHIHYHGTPLSICRLQLLLLFCAIFINQGADNLVPRACAPPCIACERACRNYA